MSSSSDTPKELFMWITTIIGFIVDVITLIMFFPTTFLTPEGAIPPKIPVLELGAASVEYKDITLVILAYIFFGFFYLAYKSASVLREKATSIVFLLPHFWIGLFVLWLLVFQVVDGALFMPATFIWIYSLIIIYSISSSLAEESREEVKTNNFPRGCLTIFILPFPLLFYFNKLYYELSYLLAFGYTIFLVTISVIYSVCIIYIAASFMEGGS